MAGSLLGPDQVRKINATFPALVAHVRELLTADHTGVGLMRVHAMVESFDSDEMARIFRELSFISPYEKKALVRAAIYELMSREPALFVSPNVEVSTAGRIEKREGIALEAPKVFTPPQFKLNVVTSGAEESAKTDTKPEPKVTSTHTPIVAKQVEAGVEQQKAQQAKLDAAVAKLRADSAPKKIEIMEVPADTVIGVDPALEGSDKTVVAEIAPDGTITVEE